MVQKKTYIVNLPPRKEQGFSDFTKLEITVANSAYEATKNVLFRKANGFSHESQRRARVLSLIDDMNYSQQNLEKYAYEIETDLFENEKKVSYSDSHFKQAQEVFLADEIAKKKGFPGMEHDYLNCARIFLDFYDKHAKK